MDGAKFGLKGGIAERSMQYALETIILYRELRQDHVGRVIGKQFLRSGTAIGANVQEAQGAQSKADFIAKMSIAHKEALESAYWLKLFAKAQIIPDERLALLLAETEQLIKILSAILITAKKGKKSGNYPAAPHLLCHRPAHVAQVHFADLFRASGALLNSYSARFCPISALSWIVTKSV